MKISPKQKKVIIPNIEGCLIEVESVDFYLESYERGKYEITIENLINEASLRGVDMSNLKDLVKRKESILELVTLSKFDNAYFPLLGIFLALNNTIEVVEILNYHLKTSYQVERFVLCIESVVIGNLKISPLRIDSNTINLIIDWVETSKKQLPLLISEHQKNKEVDCRINSGLDAKTVRAYFEVLLVANKDGEPFLTSAELDSILFRHFWGYSKPTKYLSSQIPTARLNHKRAIGALFYGFYSAKDYNKTAFKERYAEILKKEFECFNHDTIESIKKILALTTVKYNPFIN